MARFRVEGLEAVIRDMAQMQQHVGPVADEMLKAGAEVVRWEWQKSIKEAGHIATGSMFGSVRPTKIKEKAGVKYLDVYPQGKDETGTRNAEKAFIANFGRERQKASRFADRAEKRAEQPARTAMAAVWDAFIPS